MLTKEYTIIEPFTRQPWEALTFKQVKKLSKNRSDHYVHTSLKSFVKKGVLKQKKIGNNILYSMDNSIHALNTFGHVAEYKAKNTKYLPHKNINKLIERIKTSFYVFIITGSYAKKKQTEKSDIDIVIICDDKRKPNNILSQIKLEAETMIPEVHPYVFTEAQFYEMLVNKEENYGKEISRNNIIITGAKSYYNIIRRAIENGFTG